MQRLPHSISSPPTNALDIAFLRIHEYTWRNIMYIFGFLSNNLFNSPDAHREEINDRADRKRLLTDEDASIEWVRIKICLY